MPGTDLSDDRPDDPGADEALIELAERGLRHYTARVAAAVGAGPEAVWCEWADAPSAYVALDQRLSGHPDRDTALIWAAERGWAVAVETGCGEDLMITASLSDEVLPAPETVGTWFNVVAAGQYDDTHRSSGPPVSAEVIRGLANWARRDPACG
ncbi:DUF6292 family protein [Saccharomonospora sp. NPDC006951]